ncbi:glycosyltransferase family 25 protein [Piedraia hortae CBS 480.64]|uniref:Glycosyltransferase family 25 protein n=1 Tax=Piedraia hortae CBS 480.64 TaxID=1314780 RepID=A0A6A7C3S0_9PEZI|nr:glycosyltransferase family 25 protein [Piedraia hortae CBS 480.64]
MLAHRSPLPYMLLAGVLIGLTLLYHRSPHRAHRPLPPANATLDFGGLFVVSGPGSPRRPYLEQAANVTGLELTIPEQTAWTDEDVRNFRSSGLSESHILTGSVKAWLSHHVVLREFLASGLETAVIFEDDVDWDIRLKNIQIPLAQRTVRALTRTTTDQRQYPWGYTADWDLLYIGHCGDYFGDVNKPLGVGHHHPHDLAGVPHALYVDHTMPDRTDLHPYTASLLSAFKLPEFTRVVHQSVWPLCTFAYAINRNMAERILDEIAPPKEDPAKNLVAFDAAILVGCRDYGLKCLSVTPELFHHMPGQSLIASQESKERNILLPPVDAAGLEQTHFRKETSNIQCGFSDGSFYFGTDNDRLELLKEQIGRKNRCLKMGRDPDSGRPAHYRHLGW